MYQVYRNNRVLKSLGVFEEYEKARQGLRKYIRKLVASGKAAKEEFQTTGCFYGWDEINRNPVNFTEAGFNIKRITN